ncbi:MAG: amino acid adenylation domain-containing protein, partial [Clostridium sp.]
MKSSSENKNISFFINEQDINNYIEQVELPTDYNLLDKYNFKEIVLKLDDKFTKTLKNIIKDNSFNQNEVFLSVLSVLFSKFTNQQDFTLSFMENLKHNDEIILFRSKPYGYKKVKDFFIEVKQSINSSTTEYTEKEFRSLNLFNKSIVNDLFNVLIINGEREDSLENLGALTIKINFVEDKYTLIFKYLDNVFNSTTIQNIADYFEIIFYLLINNMNSNMNEIEFISERDKYKILNEFNNTYLECDYNKTIQQVFEEQVNIYSENVAIVLNDKKLTYKELNQKSNKIARKLRSIGVKPNERVAIIAKREIETIIGIYGILKAGAAYVPIDSEYPIKRIEFIIKDSGSKILLSNNYSYDFGITNIDIKNEENNLFSSENLNNVNKPSDLAYVIYTSGTTGVPKGVMIEHKGVINLREYSIKDYDINSKDVILQFASLSFDASVSEMTMALLTGATLCLIPKDIIENIQAFEKYVYDNNVTIVTLPPQYCAQVKLKNIKLLITAGSESNRSIVENNKHIRYINAYGPTENTVCATHWERKDNFVGDKIPIGKPMYNVNAYIMSEGSLCGIGMIGELCITGPGLARGYLNREDLTKEKFIENYYFKGKRIYKTGDLARWLPDGNIEYLGRIDEQVKISGYRIELTEIDNIIRNKEHIIDVISIVKSDEDNNKFICTYIVADVNIDTLKLKNELKDDLPKYMIPAFIQQLEKMPLTVNGKVDKQALLSISFNNSNQDYLEAKTELEKVLVDTIVDVLKVNKISLKDNLYQYGMDSIKAIRISSILREKGYDIAVKDIFRCNDILELAKSIKKYDLKNKNENDLINTEETIKYFEEFYGEGKIQKIYKLTPMQEGMLYHKLKDNDSNNYFLQEVISIKSDITYEEIYATMNLLLYKYDVLRTAINYKNGIEPVQIVIKDRVLESKEINLINESNKEEVLNNIIKSDIKRGFDLEKDSLMRITFLRFNENESKLIWSFHHIILDGWSVPILYRDFVKYLKKIKNHVTINEIKECIDNETNNKATYSDFVNRLLSKDSNEALKYFNNLLYGFEGESKIMSVSQNNVAETEETIKEHKIKFDDKVVNSLYEFVTKKHVTLNTVFESGWGILLQKYNRSNDIVFGKVVSGRNIDIPEIENNVGLFINTIPVRVKCHNDSNCIEIINNIYEQELDSFNYDYCSLAEIQSKCTTSSSLFNTLFVFENYYIEENYKLELKNLNLKVEKTRQQTNYPITITIVNDDNTIEVGVMYDPKLYSEYDISQL